MTADARFARNKIAERFDAAVDLDCRAGRTVLLPRRHGRLCTDITESLSLDAIAAELDLARLSVAATSPKVLDYPSRGVSCPPCDSAAKRCATAADLMLVYQQLQ